MTQLDGEIFRGRGVKGHAAGVRLLGAQIAAGGVFVGPGPVVGVEAARRPNVQPVFHERTFGADPCVRAAIVANDQIDVAVEFVARRPADEIDRAAEGGPAEEGALRALHDLHALDVVHRQPLAGSRQIDAVHERGRSLRAAHARRRIDGAEPDRRIVAVGGVIAHVHAGDELKHVLDIGDLLFPELLGAESRYAQRNVLNRLVALARGNDDFLNFSCI